MMKAITLDEMMNVNGGAVRVNPNGSCDTEDKYFIVDDLTGIILALTGGYRKARKLAESFGQSPELAQ